jgi:hypothetical protein
VLQSKPNFARVLISADSVSIAGQGFSSSDEPNSSRDITGAVQALQTLLAQSGANSPLQRVFARRVSVIVDPGLLRHLCCDWEASLRSVADFQRYASIEFERRFAQSCSEWHLEPNLLRPNQVTAWVAYPKLLIEQLQAVLKKNRMVLAGVQSEAMVQLQIAMQGRFGHTTQFLGAGLVQKPAILVVQGAVHEVLFVPQRIDDDQVIGMMLNVRGSIQPMQIRTSIRIVLPHEQLRRLILNSSPLPHGAVQERVMTETPLAPPVAHELAHVRELV